jgi:hypothetical protein
MGAIQETAAESAQFTRGAHRPRFLAKAVQAWPVRTNLGKYGDAVEELIR